MVTITITVVASVLLITLVIVLASLLMKGEDKHGRLYGEPAALARFSRRLMDLRITLPHRDPNDVPARMSGRRDTYRGNISTDPPSGA